MNTLKDPGQYKGNWFGPAGEPLRVPSVKHFEGKSIEGVLLPNQNSIDQAPGTHRPSMHSCVRSRRQRT